MKRIINDDAGMSLVEITFAMAILATTLSLLFGSLISITVIGRVNEDKALANTALSSVLEDMRRMPLADLVTYAPELPDHPGVDRTVLIECYNEDGVAVELPLPVEGDGAAADVAQVLPDLPNPLEVKATLLWTNESGHVFQSSVTTSIGR
jgi:type II secretory pathway pseudopilin PulG